MLGGVALNVSGTGYKMGWLDRFCDWVHDKMYSEYEE